MAWVFITIGLATFASVLYRLAVDVQLRRRVARGRATALDIVAYLDLPAFDDLDALRAREPALLTVIPGSTGPCAGVEFQFIPGQLGRRRRWTMHVVLCALPVHGVAIALNGTAWWLGHESGTGWACLLGALFIELLRWAADRRGPLMTALSMARDLAEHPPAPDRTNDGLHDGAPSPAARGDADGRIECSGSPAVFTTFVILREPWRPAAQALYAALRRCGQRDVAAPREQQEDGVAVLDVGTVQLTVRSEREGTVPAGLAQRLRAGGMDGHLAADADFGGQRLVITTERQAGVAAQNGAAASDTTRLHARTHAAVAEFAPVIGAWWPDTERWVPVGQLRADAQCA